MGEKRLKIRIGAVLAWSCLLLGLNGFAQPGYIYPMGVAGGEDSLFNKMPLKADQTSKFRNLLPSQYSLKKFSPSPGMQMQATCVVWAVSYGARTIIEAEKNNWNSQLTIDANAFTPAFQYRLIEPNFNICDGAETGKAIVSLQKDGALPLRYWKRTESEFHCPTKPLEDSLFKIASEYKIRDFAKLFDKTEISEQKVVKTKLSLTNGNPVVIGFYCPPSFHNIDGSKTWRPIENQPFADYSRHAVVVVAYDDNKEGGAFQILNSWGTNYADSGFVWVRYADYEKWVYQAVEIIQLKNATVSTPVFKGGLRVFSIDDAADLEVIKASINRNWSLGGADAEHTYKIRKPLPSGSRIRLFIENELPSYVYVIGSGSVNTDVGVLFPMEGYSAALNYKDNEVALPNESLYFESDNTIGKDYLAVIFSRNPIDIEDLKNKISNSQGSFAQKLKEAIGTRLLKSDNIQLSANKISFTANAEGGEDKVMALIIENDHVEKNSN